MMKKIKSIALIISIAAVVSAALFLGFPDFLANANLMQSSSRAEFTHSEYKTAGFKPAGWFTTGQNADMMLSGVDFNNTGGPLLFNHPGNLATDGIHLILADRNNNRVLIWNKLPASDNAEPDIVLGQRDFISNNPGKGLDQMNWPIGIATDGKKLLVTDVENNRVLIWNNFPAESGQPADLILGGVDEPSQGRRGSIIWPWAVWTDGEKVVVTSTASSQVLIWNSFPAESDQKPDITIQLPGKFGTPRSIGSDGRHLAIGDHNAFGNKQGTFFWKSFPAQNDQVYDFFIADPGNIGSNEPASPGVVQGIVLYGMAFKDGKFVALSNRINIWDSFPEDENDRPDAFVGSRNSGAAGYDFGGGQSGDGSGIAIAGERFYASLSNGNKIIGFNSFPAGENQLPDVVVGSPDIYTNTLNTEFIISNPFPITDGKSLFVLSDFDGKMYVWKNLPDESAAKPDIVYNELPAGTGFIFNNMLVAGRRENVFVWNKIPLNGEKPDVVLSKSIGNAAFGEVRGLAMDEKYFYLADNALDKIYVWEGMPNRSSSPKFILDIEKPERLSTDGNHLVVSSQSDKPGGSVRVYNIGELSSPPKYIAWDCGDAGLPGCHFNLPGHAIVKENHLFVADTNFNRVLAWDDIEDAIAGRKPDVFLGADNSEDVNAETGRGKLFMPHSLAFDGGYLWVGEVKFSERILRFSVQ